MKIAYVIATASDKLDGIGNKVVGQSTAWRELGLDARLMVFSPRTGTAMNGAEGWILDMSQPLGSGILGKVKRLYQYLRGALILMLWRPDIIYTRAGYRPFGASLWQIFGSKVILEINSDLVKEVENHISSGVIDPTEGRRRLKLWKSSLAKCDGMVSVSYQMDVVNKPFLGDKPHAVVWNSVSFTDSKLIERSNQKNRLPKLCFIGAENFSWNGLDLLKNFAAATVGDLEFVVIGASDDGSYSENIQIHPYLEHVEMMKVLASCDVGLGTLALFRKGLDECSALKVRDYAALGLPMVLCYKETPFVDKELPMWVLELNNGEDTLIQQKTQIIEFCKQWQCRSFEKIEAEPFYESEIIEGKRVEFMKTFCS